MANLRNFDLNLLLVLDGVLREGTLSNAATALKVGQPTTSSSLAKLREILQDELFVRSENGMQPTPRALALKEPVQRVLTAVKGEILDTGRFDPATEIRPYTVATPDIGEKVLLPRVVARASDEGEREHKPETPGAAANKRYGSCHSRPLWMRRAAPCSPHAFLRQIASPITSASPLDTVKALWGGVGWMILRMFSPAARLGLRGLTG